MKREVFCFGSGECCFLFSFSRTCTSCVMASRPPRDTFSRKRIIRILVDDVMSLDALSVVKLLPDFQEKIAGVVPNLGATVLTSL